MKYLEVGERAHEDLGMIICYPRPSANSLKERISELRMLGISSLTSMGISRIGDFNVLGKGHSSVVVAAVHWGSLRALKIRRVDSKRDCLEREARLLMLANWVDVGPKLHAYSRNFIVMDLVEGMKLREWARGMRRREDVASMLRKLMIQCRMLDSIGLFHGEISRADEHVMITDEGPVIIDFDSSSLTSRKSNVTAVIQYLLIRKGLYKVLGMSSFDDLYSALREYKVGRNNGSFRKLMEVMGL